MARLKYNGAVVLSYGSTRIMSNESTRIMSNGAILRKRGQAYSKSGKIKPGVSFAEVKRRLENAGVIVTVCAPAWLPLLPSPVSRTRWPAPPGAGQAYWLGAPYPGIARARDKARKL